ncbi:hypothetical protein ACI7RC_15830 [Brevibacillus sp. B_LB10_24]|uniref:hypothetical protein n=1 Tax=Brevibacillus sp. B_LB10_24 TaxID=3380645 RepID=UPI0038B730A2
MKKWQLCFCHLNIPDKRRVVSGAALSAAYDFFIERQCLWGFPHPSGANGHRHQQFASNYPLMKNIVHRFFSSNLLQ